MTPEAPKTPWKPYRTHNAALGPCRDAAPLPIRAGHEVIGNSTSMILPACIPRDRKFLPQSRKEAKMLERVVEAWCVYAEVRPE